MALQTRPEPMNASPHHPKVRVTMKFADSIFHAGGEISGKMEMECKTDKGLGIGIIMVELFAIEEITSRDHSATSTFMHSRRIFQGPGLPPSNAVHTEPVVPALPAHHYPARKGITTFLFKFKLPKSSPSSITFGSGLARVRYEVTASVGVVWKGENRLVTSKKEVDVVECWDESLAQREPEGVIIGEEGKIWVQGKVVGGFMVAGQPACIELQVKNHSTKKNTGLSITMTRSLVLPDLLPGQKPGLDVSDTLTSVSFRGHEYIIHPGVEGVANLVLDLPKDARVVKGGTRYSNEENRKTPYLFEIRCIAAIRLSMGFGNKDIQLNLPVAILHHSVIPDLPLPDPHMQLPQHLDMSLFDPSPAPLYFSAAAPLPFMDRPLSPLSPMSPTHHLNRPLSPSSYPGPTISPPPVPYADQRLLWSSAVVPHYQPPNLLAVTTPDHGVSSMTHIPLYTSSPRPGSAEPLRSQPLYDFLYDGYTSRHQPLISLPAGSNAAAERIEGKGERASRITQHLRMSSRNRSASPPSHHYAMTPMPNPHSRFAAAASSTTPRSTHSQLVPATSPLAETSPDSQPKLSVSPLLSPRPMPSPKHSLTTQQSAQVATLERIVAEVDVLGKQSASDRSPLDKTLPRLPGTSKAQTIRPDARELFPDIVDDQVGTDKPRPPTPPTPTLAALKSPRTARSNPNSLSTGGFLSGLDALEAKLLAEVGTRKLEQTEQRPDVRSVLPIAIPRSRDEPPNDSAISSLTLPELEPDEGTLKIGLASDKAAKVEDVPPLSRELPELRKTLSSERVKERTSSSSARKVKSSRKAGEPGPDTTKDAEMHKLRKVAQGRIAAWLDSIEPEAPPQSENSASFEPEDLNAHGTIKEGSKNTGAQEPPLPSSSAEDVVNETASAAPNPRSSGFVPIGSIQATISRSRFINDVQAQTRSREHVIIPSNAPEPSLPSSVLDRLAVSTSTRPDTDIRYNARSARGGRGGKVTAIAAMWASATQGQGKIDPVINPLAKREFRAPKVMQSSQHSPTESPIKPGIKPALRPLLSPRLQSKNPSPQSSSSSPSSSPLASNTKPMSFANLAAKRADIIKSSSVPAVISSSLAKPMLSSTASLARPIPPLLERNRVNVLLPPTLSESISPPKAPSVLNKSPGRTELAFGQAKLRELIQRYQGGGS